MRTACFSISKSLSADVQGKITRRKKGLRSMLSISTAESTTQRKNTTFPSYGTPGSLGNSVPQRKKLKKLEDRIRQITRRNRGVKIERVIRELNSVLRGWVGYFARSSMKAYLKRPMEWVRRRIRQYLWKQWKNGRNRKHRLRQLGVAEWQLAKWKLGSNTYWKMAGVMGYLIRNETIHAGYGLVNVVEYYISLHDKRMETDRVVLDWRYNSLFS
jgi:hypothetical protein